MNTAVIVIIATILMVVFAVIFTFAFSSEVNSDDDKNNGKVSPHESEFFEVSNKHNPDKYCPITQYIDEYLTLQDDEDLFLVVYPDKMRFERYISDDEYYDHLTDEYIPRNRHKPKRNWYSQPGVHRLCNDKEHNSKRQRYPYYQKHRANKSRSPRFVESEDVLYHYHSNQYYHMIRVDQNTIHLARTYGYFLNHHTGDIEYLNVDELSTVMVDWDLSKVRVV